MFYLNCNYNIDVQLLARLNLVTIASIRPAAQFVKRNVGMD